MEREKGLWFSELKGWWGSCKMFCVLFPLFLHFALLWRLCSESQSGNLSLLKSPRCCSSKTQLPEIHLDIYMLCPIISSSKRNYSKILFHKIMPPIGFLFFLSPCCSWQRNMAVYVQTSWRLEERLFLQCIYLSAGT